MKQWMVIAALVCTTLGTGQAFSAPRGPAQMMNKRVLDQVNKKLARQQVVDGQFQFGSGSSELIAGNEKRIKGLLRVIEETSPALGKALPNFKLVARGHTDSDGSAELNQKLSQARAETVCAKLKEGGLSVPCEAVGYGESKLLVRPERTPRDKQKNRRVIVQVDN